MGSAEKATAAPCNSELSTPQSRSPAGFALLRDAALRISVRLGPVLVIAAMAGSSAFAQWPLPTKSSPARHNNRASKATTSRAARDSAIRSIPFDKLSVEAREKATAVIKSTTVFRRLPVQVIDCDPELYAFMINNPDVVVDIWEVLGVSEVALERIGDGAFRANDGEGTLGVIQYLYKSHDTQIIYGEGKYEGALFQKPVHGKCLMVLKSGYARETNGRYYITSRLDTFISLDHIGAEVLVKAFQPLVGKVADYNFRETTAFLASLSRTAEVNPAGVLRLAARLDNITDTTRGRFITLCDQISVNASVAQTSATEEPARRTAVSRGRPQSSRRK